MVLLSLLSLWKFGASSSRYMFVKMSCYKIEPVVLHTRAIFFLQIIIRKGVVTLPNHVYFYVKWDVTWYCPIKLMNRGFDWRFNKINTTFLYSSFLLNLLFKMKLISTWQKLQITARCRSWFYLFMQVCGAN